ncbi:MAG: glucuronate isomerase [Chloroflexota bacterium]
MRPIDRYLDPDLTVRYIAKELYNTVADLPLICPHGHVDPTLFADPDYRFGSPTELFIIPDHYVLRMLYSQGVALEELGILPKSGSAEPPNYRAIWQTFADHYYLFRGTPSGIWIKDSLATIFGVNEKLSAPNAQAVYDHVSSKLQQPDFAPRQLYKRFNIELLCTTDAATDSLAQHQAIRDSGWHGRILPTFRPDALLNLDHPNWRQEIDLLNSVLGIEIDSYGQFIEALESRRAFFKTLGATATDHSVLSPFTAELSSTEADGIFQKALRGEVSAEDSKRFTGHMLLEMARMSTEDGLVMQLHVGSYRNHNQPIFDRFGANMGADIPVCTEFTHNLAPLLQKYGNDPRLALIIFTLDESTYSRELAPLAGHYPALKIGPPWWFHDSVNGMRRYFDEVMETAGIYNTVGFNDDTRAFTSIPVRHDVWRRSTANWLGRLVAQDIVDMEDASEMAYELAYGLAKKGYELE